MLVHRGSIVAKAPSAAIVVVAPGLLVTGYAAWAYEGWQRAMFSIAFAICAFVTLAAIYFLIAKRGN